MLNALSVPPLGQVQARVGASRGPLGGSWDALGRSWDVWGRLWAFLGAIWGLLERSWSFLGSLGLQVVDHFVIFRWFWKNLPRFFRIWGNFAKAWVFFKNTEKRQRTMVFQ